MPSTIQPMLSSSPKRPPEITLRDIYGSILPFVLVMVLALAIIMAFPDIALWLPGYVYGN